MMSIAAPLYALLLSAAAAAPSAPLAADEVAPPGLVFIEGGRTQIGTSLKDMKKLFEEHPQLAKNSAGFLSEVPRHTANVDDFFLMVTEVTNEQYLEFVKGAGARPPRTWAEESIGEARAAFLQADAERRRKAKEEGRPVPDRQAFDEAEWWQRNWKDAAWEMPTELARKPVVYVDFQDARAYARWAGLRLMTEQEYERAARGKTERVYPWGDEFEASKYAATVEMRGVSDVFEVGSFPEGADEAGVLDLAGNVWEWTSSKYLAYPGWKHKKFTVGKGNRKKTIDTPPAFSPDRRVVRGGSMQNSRFMARATTRGGFDRYQRASALGFRCAASTKRGFDFSVTLEDDIPNQIRPQTEEGPVEYDPNQVIALDRWIRGETQSKVPGYGVIQSYDFILFTPAKSIPTTGAADITKSAKDDEVFHIGFLGTSQDMVEPALPAGTYLVALRGKGKAAERKPEKGPDGEEIPPPPTLADLVQFDDSVENFIFYDMSGAPVAAVPLAGMQYGNPSPSKLSVVDRTILVPDGEEEVEVTQKWLDLELFAKGKSRKGVKTTLSLRFGDGVLSGDWR